MHAYRDADVQVKQVLIASLHIKEHLCIFLIEIHQHLLY